MQAKEKNKKKRHITKISYRSSEGRSSSRRFSKCENYDAKTSENIRNCNIPSIILTYKSEGIQRDMCRFLKIAVSAETFINNCKNTDFRTSKIELSAETSCELWWKTRFSAETSSEFWKTKKNLKNGKVTIYLPFRRSITRNVLAFEFWAIGPRCRSNCRRF